MAQLIQGNAPANVSAATMSAPKRRPVISVRQFMESDLAQVKKLFHDVMMTFYTDPSSEFHTLWREHTQKRLHTDLSSIHSTYIAPGGNFLVAVVPDPDEGGDERIAGIVGLERKSESEGELRSMCVSVDHQRLGVGRVLMAQLLDSAQALGFARLSLFTFTDNVQSRGFYESLGFTYQPNSQPLAFFDGRLELVEYVKLL